MEEVEVHVRQIDEDEMTADKLPIAEMMRRLMLASIGAVALTYDEAERFIQRLVERGELAQKDGEKVLREVTERFRQQKPSQTVPTDVAERAEGGFEQFLRRMNIPAKSDIDELSSKIAQLSARVEEMRRQQTES